MYRVHGKLKARSYWDTDKIIVLAHRGLRLKYIENTVEALVRAIEYGADGVEFDVRLTSDGVPVIFHDTTFKRLAGVDVRLREHTYEEVRRIDLRKRGYVPTLEEVLDRMPRHALLDIEVKELDAVEKTYELVAEKGWLDRTVFTSSDHRVLRKFRKLYKDVRLGYVIWNTRTFLNVFELHRKLKLFLVVVSVIYMKIIGYKIFKDYLRKLRSYRLKIILYPVNNPEYLIDFKGLYNGIITDNLEKILRSTVARTMLHRT